jgi:hypothetical protein
MNQKESVLVRSTADLYWNRYKRTAYILRWIMEFIGRHETLPNSPLCPFLPFSQNDLISSKAQMYVGKSKYRKLNKWRRT